MDSTSIIDTIGYLAVRLAIIGTKSALVYTILATCHQGLEDDRHGSVNQRSAVYHRIISLLFLGLTIVGLYGVYTSHLGLFFTWFLLRPIVYILDLESSLWTAIAMSLIASGGTLSYVTYEPIAALLGQLA
ncbi:uncharacterized protein LOC128956565 [Oppia nitens]|uniref:uncharacterized protein LOC128956565 n=1 Tax=Oppia nitens TaxID=1686743 RepID=UPI0023DBA582|nr:uncharacterized protein LOC128956565 [Oppia nitens]